MSSTDRQNNLLVSEDWQKIYQSFKNADFQSYDFENLRRTMVDYIRTNFPEDFNDYTESSEYLALIDLIAYVGQSIAFRVDLNARENFLELAERRDSVLRLARMISYNASRNVPASGLLKVSTISTTENVLDSNGINLAGQVVTWNDPSNSNWYDQFIKVINAALPQTQQFGNPVDSAEIYGINTAQYRFNANNTGVPVYSFTKPVAGRSMDFEITSTTFSGKSVIYEEPPKIGNSIACVYQDDGYGAGSPTTGFFFNFTQGTLNQATFNISQPTSNETIDIDSKNINNTDVWLYSLNQATGLEKTLWTQVSATTGNNVIYNSLNSKIKTIYSVISRASDSVTLSFADGTFGQLPLGNFRVYYRVSNGLTYTINQSDILNVSIGIPYISANGQPEVLSLTLGLATSVNNSSSAETNTSVKKNAPPTYYTQNRMITGEDYNISPLSVTQLVAKIKSVNRTSSGISRYFDLTDPTGKYSSTNLFADDGILYQEPYVGTSTFSYITKTDIEGIIYNQIFKLLDEPDLRNFYYANFINYITKSLNISWYNSTSDSNSSTGYVGNSSDATPYKVSSFTTTNLKYFTTGALVKFTAPTGRYFDTNNLNQLVTTANRKGVVSYVWAQVVSISGNGLGDGNGSFASTGLGAITLNKVIPTSAVVDQIIPSLAVTIGSSVITTMIDLIFSNHTFGLRYESTTQTWQIVFESNLNVADAFSLANQGDTTNSQQDSSWLLLFTTDNQTYTIRSRLLRYIFESSKEVSFYFDSNLKIYDTVSSSTITDSLKVLSINTHPRSTTDTLGTYPFTVDLNWEITSAYVGLDGYVDPKKIVVTFASSENNGAVDNPQLFLDLVEPSYLPLTKYIVQEKYLISLGQEDYRYVYNDTANPVVVILPTDPTTYTSYNDGQYFYFVDTQVVKKYNAATSSLIPTLDYKVYIGRDNLKFQYIHNADYDSRIDPGASNIMDIYVLTVSYDTKFRQWLAGANVNKPLPPSSSELNSLLSPSLNLIKSISDEIIYHPVSYTLLFGSQADLNLQATFNVVKNPNSTASDNDIISRVITAFDRFFALDNWNFGDTFYFTELSTYVINQLTPDISSFVIVPKQNSLYFGSLFEIQCPSNQIFISCAQASDIVIVSGLTSDNLKTTTGQNSSNLITSQNITTATFGVSNGQK
jgi:hypothetical protein